MTFLGNTAIVGVGYSELSRNSHRSVLDLAVEACRNAISDAGLDPQDVDGIGSFSWANDSVPAQSVATALAFRPQTYVLDLSLGGEAPCLLAMNAAMAIASGLAESIVIYRALNGRSGLRVGSTPVSGPGAQYRYPIGFTAYPQYTAMWARRYLIETGATEQDLSAVAISQRAYAVNNARAVIRSKLTFDDYMAMPLVADPLRVPDCALEVDGACALLITSLERARTLRNRPAVISGAAYVCGPRSGLDIGDALFWEDYSRNFTSFLAPRLWKSAGLGPGDMDFAEIYDCFTSTVLMGLEGLGLVGRGEAGPFVQGGETSLTGSLPVNTNGGLLSEGYLHGANTLAEAVLQLQHRSSNPLDTANACVVTSGGLMDGSALVLVGD